MLIGQSFKPTCRLEQTIQMEHPWLPIQAPFGSHTVAQLILVRTSLKISVPLTVLDSWDGIQKQMGLGIVITTTLFS